MPKAKSAAPRRRKASCLNSFRRWKPDPPIDGKVLLLPEFPHTHCSACGLGFERSGISQTFGRIALFHDGRVSSCVCGVGDVPHAVVACIKCWRWYPTLRPLAVSFTYAAPGVDIEPNFRIITKVKRPPWYRRFASWLWGA